MIVCGIDLGSRSAALVCLRAGEAEPLAKVCIQVPETSLECCRQMGAMIRFTFATPPWSEAGLAWLERPMGRQVKSVSDLARVGGSIASSIPPSCALEEIAPQDWKRLVGLRGNATKGDVQAWCRSEGFEPASEHLADAYAVARSIWIYSDREGTRPWTSKRSIRRRATIT